MSTAEGVEGAQPADPSIVDGPVCKVSNGKVVFCWIAAVWLICRVDGTLVQIHSESPAIAANAAGYMAGIAVGLAPIAALAGLPFFWMARWLVKKRKVSFSAFFVIGLAVSTLVIIPVREWQNRTRLTEWEIQKAAQIKRATLDRLEWVEGKLSLEDGLGGKISTTFLSGRIKNGGTISASSASVKIYFYDALTNVIDTASVNLTFSPVLEPGDVKSFSTAIHVDNLPSGFHWTHKVVDFTP